MSAPSLFSLLRCAVVPDPMSDRMREAVNNKHGFGGPLIYRTALAARPSHCTDLEAALTAVVEAARKPLSSPLYAWALCRICNESLRGPHKPDCALARIETLASQAGKGKT